MYVVDQPEKKIMGQKSGVSLVAAVGQEIVTSGLIRQPLKKNRKNSYKSTFNVSKVIYS